MNLIQFFNTLERKMDEGEEILKFTQIDSKEYSILIENLGTTLGILRNAEDLYKHFSQFEQNSAEDNSSDDEFNLIKGQEYKSIYGLDPKEIDVVAFTSDNCGWCEKLKPVLKKAEEAGVKIEYVDADVHNEHTSNYEVSGYPTVFFIENGLISEVSVGYAANLMDRFYQN